MYLIVESNNDFNKLQEAKKNTNIFVWYYADWCGHCQMMKDEWEKVVKSKPHVNLAKVSDTYVKPEDNIMGFPTLKLFKSNNSVKTAKGKKKEIIDYQGSRDANSLLKFIKENVKKSKRGSKSRSLKKRKYKKARKNTRRKRN